MRHSPTSRMTKLTRLIMATKRDRSRKPWALREVAVPAQPIKIMTKPLKQF